MKVESGRKNHPIFFILIFLIFASCSNREGASPVIPPVTSPLIRSYIGYGVINVSYTHIIKNPTEQAISSGYLRRGSLVRILERRVISRGNSIEYWVLAEGDDTGWLREEIVDIYDNELQAKTAAEAMDQ